MKSPILLALLLGQLGCMAHHRGFEVLREPVDYVLRSPDSSTASFPEVLKRYSGFTPGQEWIDLRPHMDLRVENAYYVEGAPKHGLAGFVGTEIAFYRVWPEGGLRLVSLQSMAERPKDQPPVERLIDASRQSLRYFRFFFALVFRRSGNTRGSVLLGAASKPELEALTARLLEDPESTCEAAFDSCTIFPEACSVSLEIDVTVNEDTRTVPWGSTLATVVVHPRRIDMLRLDRGRMTPVRVDANDPGALLLPLLPEDRIRWK